MSAQPTSSQHRPGAQNAVVGLLDVAEGGQALVLADRRQLVAPAGQDLVRICLMSDVPEDLVARRVEDRVQRDGQLAGAEVGAEVAADLADGVDDVLAHLLGDARELLVVEAVQVLRAVDGVQEAGAHDVRVAMKSVICWSSGAPWGAAASRAARAFSWDARAMVRAPSRPN